MEFVRGMIFKKRRKPEHRFHLSNLLKKCVFPLDKNKKSVIFVCNSSGYA